MAESIETDTKQLKVTRSIEAPPPARVPQDPGSAQDPPVRRAGQPCVRGLIATVHHLVTVEEV